MEENKELEEKKVEKVVVVKKKKAHLTSLAIKKLFFYKKNLNKMFKY